MEIKELHEELFNYLLKKHEVDNSFRFLLRAINRGGRLERGYWFYGTDYVLSLSFWNAVDSVMYYPNIRFNISADLKCQLLLQIHHLESNSQEKRSLLSDIARGLNILRDDRKGQNIDTWIKNYPSNQSYIKNLEDFLQKEKPVIDALLRVNNKKQAIPFFTQAKFSTDLAKIEKWRAALNQTITFDYLEEMVTKSLRPIHLYLKNITRFEEIELDLSKRVICIVGKNGSGKSSVLRGIALGLTGISPFKKEGQSLPKPIQSLLKITQAEGSKLTYESEGLITVLYQLDDYSEDNPCVNPIILRHSELTRGVVDGDDDLETANGSGFTLNTIENGLKYLLLGFSQQSKAKSETKEDMGSGLPHISDIEDLILDRANDRFDTFHSWLVKMLSPLKESSPQIIEENEKFISQIMEVIASIVGDDKLKLSGAYSETNIKTKLNPKGIPMLLMSQGYRNVIGWVGFLMKRLYEYGQRVLPTEKDFRKIPAVCLIDEIDTYLHPEWQHLILKGLTEQFPNVYFIVTSHSPYILASIPEKELKIYEIQTNDSEPRTIENLYGADINRATQAMHVSVRLKELTDSVEDVYR